MALMHVSPRTMSLLHKHARGVPPLSGTQTVCDSCMEYKFKKLHLSSVKERRTSRVGEWTHSDIFGCACEDLYFGARYAVCFVDDFSKYVMVLPMLNRTTASLRRAFCVYVSRMAVFGHIVAGLQYDGAQEYVSAEHSDFLDELAVEHIATCRYPAATGSKHKGRTVSRVVKVP